MAEETLPTYEEAVSKQGGESCVPTSISPPPYSSIVSGQHDPDASSGVANSSYIRDGSETSYAPPTITTNPSTSTAVNARLAARNNSEFPCNCQSLCTKFGDYAKDILLSLIFLSAICATASLYTLMRANTFLYFLILSLLLFFINISCIIQKRYRCYPNILSKIRCD